MDNGCLLTLWILKYDSLIKKYKNEAINFNNIRVSSDYGIYNFRVVVVYIFRFKFMVWLDSTNDTDLIGNFKHFMFFYEYFTYIKET